MANEKMGKNLFMCIPPDHMRDDLPSTVTVRGLYGAEHDLYDAKGSTFNSGTPVYVGITDDLGNTVTLPCFGVQYVDGKVVVMAHRTGRPVK